jgi:uncharacterized protein YfaS (alpha-2-macroglobulin family)
VVAAGLPDYEGDPADWRPDGSEAPRKTLVARQGDKVEVRLTVSADEPLGDVVVADLLPGGFETISIAAQGLGDDEREDHYGSYDYGGRREIRLERREDRVVAVIPLLRDRTTITYELLAVTPGKYVLPPTTAEGMYEPERQAVLETGEVEVAPR